MVSGILAVGDKLGLVVYCGISCKLGISGIAAVSKQQSSGMISGIHYDPPIPHSIPPPYKPSTHRPNVASKQYWYMYCSQLNFILSLI